MKRYLVFFYDEQFPGGGMKDLVGAFDDLHDAINEATMKVPLNRNFSIIRSNNPSKGYNWHIYNSELGKIIKEKNDIIYPPDFGFDPYKIP